MPKIREEWAPERILELRQARGWTRDELGQLLGISRSAIQKWEKGQHMPKVDMLVSLAEALESHPGYFFKRVEEVPDAA